MQDSATEIPAKIHWQSVPFAVLEVAERAIGQKFTGTLCHWPPNPLKTLGKTFLPSKLPLETRQPIEIIGLNGATGGSSPSCGSCIPFLGRSPATRPAGPIGPSQPNALAANAFGPRRGERTGGGQLRALFVSTLQGAALCSGMLICGMASAEGWVRLGSDQWTQTSRGSMRSGEAKTVVPVKSEGWVSVNRFDERSRPSAAKPSIAAWTPPPMGSNVVGLRKIIRLAESNRAGYDAIHNSAKRLPSKRPTELTLGEILAWIDATPGQHHAIGQYQIIPKTLKRLMQRTGLPATTTFTAEVQDYLGDVLIVEAGYSEFRAGTKSLSSFMDGLARVWAGLPLADGRSAYHGYAGNRASISRAFFEAQMKHVFAATKVAENAG